MHEHQYRPPHSTAFRCENINDLAGDAAAIGEVTGFSPGAVATKLHRLKAVLARQFQQGGPRAD
jgi:hypothetical protein